MKKLAILLSVITVILAATGISFDTAQPHGSNEDLKSPYSKLMHEFYIRSLENYNETDLSEFTYSGIPISAIPEYYGGYYTDANRGPVIMLTSQEKNIIREIYSITQDKDIIFETSKYSFRYLLSLMSDITAFMNSDMKDKYDFYITSAAIIDKENLIEVNLIHLSENAVEEFKLHVSDSPAIVIHRSDHDSIDSYRKAVESSINDNMTKSDETPMSIGYIGPGYGLGHGGDLQGSVGVRARKTLPNGSYQMGLISAAHAFDKGQEVYLAQSFTKIGQVDGGSWQKSGSVDACFIALTSDYQGNNSITGTDYTLYTNYVSASASDNVAICGYKTRSSGTVLSTNATYDKISYVLSDMLKCTYPRKGGDSGGLVYSLETGTTSYKHAVGIHTGYEPIVGVEYSYSCKIGNVLNALGVNRY